MRTNLRIEAVQWAIIGAMFVLAAVMWSSAPDRIPLHWTLSGEPDRYGGKFEGLLLLPLITLGVYLLMWFLPKVDPRRANYALFEGAYGALRLSVISFQALLYGFILLWIQGVRLDVAVVVPVLVGGLLVVIGNLLGKIRPNWFVGVKTPWTLSSQRSWVKTHRMAGWTFVLLGLAFAALGLAGPAWAIPALVVATVGSILWLFVYSYLVWRSDPERATESGARGARGTR
jgi:uncharacterized membrane protein